jgi:hypothetical protein
MSIFTSLWFWILVLGIILTVVAVIIWAVTGNADILVGILLGLGVGWIIGGLLIWIFGRPKKAPEIPPVPPTGLYGTTMPLNPSVIPPSQGTGLYGSTIPPNPSVVPPSQGTGLYGSTMPSNPSITSPSQGTGLYGSTTPPNQGMTASQQQLMQLLQSNPQLMNSYSGAKL